jgi:hypothetical protein
VAVYAALWEKANGFQPALQIAAQKDHTKQYAQPEEMTSRTLSERF